jgi:CBS-domain-containing membrane protein
MASTIGRRWPLRRQPHVSLTAGSLMTTPAITTGPDATIPAAARLMNTHHVRRLPVIDADGKLAGIVSRRDLLSVFLRPDADIIHDARQVLDELALTDPEDVIVTVKHGVVTLTGTTRPEPDRDQDLRPLALRLIWDIDGVVDVVNELGEAKAANESKPAKTT